MNEFKIRILKTEKVNYSETYPFYRKEIDGSLTRYWRFADKNNAMVIVTDGARSTLINYTGCDSIDHTPLTHRLLVAGGPVDEQDRDYVAKIEYDEYQRARNDFVGKLFE